MALSEFRYNKKRKHYSYLYKKKGDYRQNILISTKPFVEEKKYGKKKEIKNVSLSKHPNPNSTKEAYIVTRRYIDHKDSFDDKVYQNWKFDRNDKRKIKRIKKGKWQ